MLRKNPGFTIIAIITLALGIGANTALFSVVNGVLLNPLPYPDPDRLATLSQKTAQFDSASVAYLNFLDWQKDSRSFQMMAAHRSDDFNLTGSGEAERLHGDMVSSAFFKILGVQPLMGRTFTADEDRLGGTPVVVIGSGVWKRKFGSSPDILGKSIALNGTSHTIIGVIPTRSRLQPDNDLYVPIGQWTEPTFRDRRIGMGTRVLARLAPGFTLDQARAELDRISRNLAATYPEADAGKSVTIAALKQDIVGDARPYLFELLAAVGFVLLIACANVANLLLARSNNRMREFAVRAALGAGRKRLVRQLLTESLLLAILGGGLGLLFAGWGTSTVLALMPDALPRADEITLDGRVLIFTLAISVIAGILFGLAPAFRISQTRVQETLRENGRGLSGARQRTQGALVIVEMAIALVLLFGAGLMIRSLTHLWNVDPGFNPHNVLTFGFSVAPALVSDPAKSRAALREFHDRIQAIPGVEAVSVAGGSLPMASDSNLPFWLEGQPKPVTDNEKNWSLLYLDQPDYLKTMRIPLQRGRFFTSHDDEHSTPVAVIDENFARKFFPGSDPIGRRVNIEFVGPVQIVGVVGHVKQWGLDASPDHFVQLQMHVPVAQAPDKFMPLIASAMSVVLRSSGPPLSLVPSIREAVGQMNSQQVVYNTRTMESIISASLATRRFAMILMGLFAAVALVLSSVGIYGVISNMVGQRTREIGIRLALGSPRNDVLRTVLGQGAKMALFGLAIGIGAALALSHLLSTMLFGVSATDPWTFLGVGGLLMVVALAACYIPARRAMRVDPINALRYE